MKGKSQYSNQGLIINTPFLNRDLSWLEFNERVLEQALNQDTPLLERARFLSIFESNLDEFFMKRVGYLKRASDSGYRETIPDRMQIAEVLEKIRTKIHSMQELQSECYKKEIIPALGQHGIQLLEWNETSEEEKSEIKDYFLNNVFPVLTPLAVDPSHPFPFLSNMSVSLGIKLHHPKIKQSLFARVKIPDVIPQWVQVNKGQTQLGYRFVRLIDVIRKNLGELFPEMIIEEVMPFRVTRNADIDYQDDDVEDMMDLVEEELRQRRLARVVRLEIMGTDSWIKNVLLEELELEETDVYPKKGELDYLTLREISKINIKDLAFKSWSPTIPAAFGEEKADIFRALQEDDVLIHHPYDSFSGTVEKFVRTAVDDPKVLAIKMTLYRTEAESPFIPLLIRAAESGKQVVCVVELKARFDEARNIYWGEMLEKAGVHVVYGVVGLKTHTKMMLVVRKELEGFRFYAHVGTGNYNSATAKLYTDLGLLTSNPKITSELIEVFNYLTGLSLKRNYKRFLVAPINMKERFIEFIKKEIENKKKGLPARIVAKMNSLEDQEICESLYDASNAGVSVDLIVRGFCCLKPGVKGLSKKIKVISVIGRFLEHSRIYYFQNGKKDPVDGRFYISSADWMSRNLNNRVETAIPIEKRELKKRCWDLLELTLSDQKQSWELTPDGTYTRPPEFHNKAPIGIHDVLLAKRKNQKK